MDFLLRPWHINDVQSLVQNANNFNMAKFMTDMIPHPYNEQDARNFIEMATKDNPVHIFAVEGDGRVVGGIGIHPQWEVTDNIGHLGSGLVRQIGGWELLRML